jgi:uncharacterized membrane protein
LHPFDPKTLLLARHAQHVVLIHFPIALLITAVFFDFIGRAMGERSLTEAAYYNLFVAAISTVPTIGTGFLAWQLQLESQKLKGILLLHIVMALISSMMIWMLWWTHFRARKTGKPLPDFCLPIELLAVVLIAVTGHLGGFLSGVNGPG